jgi:hypothetical protein
MNLLDDPIVHEAAKWLQTTAATEARFRTASLQPPKELLDSPLAYATAAGDEQLMESARELRRMRASLLRDATRDRIELRGPPGRLLVSSILESVMDGASDAASSGWFDAADLPPWDTWLCYGTLFSDRQPYADGLVSYVPLEFVPRVQRGIDANPVDCHAWATEDVAAIERLLTVARGV